MIKHKGILFILYTDRKNEMNNIRVTEVQSKLSQRQSIRSEIPNVLSVNVSQGGLIRKQDNSFFNERTLTFLGIIASIIALSLALWSIHRGSDISKRLSDLNLTMVDMIVESKKSPVVETSHVRSSQTIRDRLDQKREKRAERNQKLDIIVQQELKRSADLKAKHDEYIETVNKEYLETKSKMEAENTLMMQKTKQQIEEMKHRRERNSVAGMPDYMSTIPQPDPISIMSKPLANIMDATKRIGEKFGMTEEKMKEMKDEPLRYDSKFPILDTRVQDDIDLEDLERDLQLIGNYQ